MKNQVKKIMSVFLALIMLLSLFACNGIGVFAVDTPAAERIAAFSNCIPDFNEITELNGEFTRADAGSASADFDSGSGTQDDPYIISTKEQLALVDNYLSCSFKLANDIVFCEEDYDEGSLFENGWTPIASNGVFSGTFDGNNHKIVGLCVVPGYEAIETGISEDYLFGGLFGIVSGTVKNLGIIDGFIVSSADNAKMIALGSIAAVATEGAVITNCYSSMKIVIMSSVEFAVTSSAYSYEMITVAGGIVGQCIDKVIIEDCYNSGPIMNTQFNSIIPNRYVSTQMSFSAETSGIANGMSASIARCYNSGVVDASIYIYDAENGTYYPADNIELFNVAGGISSIAEQSSIVDCYNTAEILVETKDKYYSKKTSVAEASGGIVSTTSKAQIKNCYNTGDIISTDNGYAGSIAGLVGTGSVVENCYYLKGKTGGVAADASGAGGKVDVTGCTIDKMKNQSTYESFDFEDVWFCDGSSTPELIGTNPKHKITWNIDEEITETLFAEKQKIVAPESPSKEGYKFTGWNAEIPERMGTDDMEFTALFIKSHVCTYCGEEILGESNIDTHILAEEKMHSSVKIKNNTGSFNIKYGETLVLTAVTSELPEGVRVFWYVDGEKKGEGETFSLTVEEGMKTVEVKLVDSDGSVLLNSQNQESSDTEKVSVNASFFQKIISFFKNLFRLNRIITQSFDF